MVQPYVTSENGSLFDVSFNDGNTSFTIIEMTEEEINKMVYDIKSMVYLLRTEYHSLSEKAKEE